VDCFNKLVEYDLVIDESMHELSRGGGPDPGDW
jgi:hypothetical protein